MSGRLRKRTRRGRRIPKAGGHFGDTRRVVMWLPFRERCFLFASTATRPFWPGYDPASPGGYAGQVLDPFGVASHALQRGATT